MLFVLLESCCRVLGAEESCEDPGCYIRNKICVTIFIPKFCRVSDIYKKQINKTFQDGFNWDELREIFIICIQLVVCGK